MPELPLPKLEYLLGCSEGELQELELGSLDFHAQCLKRAKAEWEQAVAYREVAGVCRWLINHRDRMINLAKRIADGRQGVLQFPEFPEATRRTA